MNHSDVNQDKKVQWLEQLVGRDLLDKMLCSFSKSTGLKAILVDNKGNTLISTDHAIKDCDFCQMIKSDSNGAKKCQRSYARACIEASKYGEPYIFRCHAGLIMWAAPILLDGYVGSIICGQVLMWEPEDYFLEEIEEMVKGLHIDIAAVKWSASQLEIMSSDKVQAAADLLFVVANQVMQSGMTVLEQRREIAAQQARLAEEIQARKRAEVAMSTIESRTNRINSLEKEQELRTMVRNGEKRAAERLLEKILVDIFAKNSNHLDTLKTRVMELVVIISRAAVDGGAELSEVLQLNAIFYQELHDIPSSDELCLWTKKMLESYMSYLESNKNQKNLQAIQKAAEYIRNNYRNKLTIDDIAQAVYLSPCYVSRIFKQGLGCTLMEYLTQVRVEEAKTMLKNPKYNVMQVAEESGFEDPGYFTRVFKKLEGVTPSRFKQHAL
ncbi:PocR ligand-binding domain-containing protein [Desulfosporosinus meridiei]|uniref:Response regulator containing CheY-like receiver domain and AraC-type DNA-binding domain n=1 Tax=Desulfosporosinus meridiei (strain ATCC BAA-275 / DSM 13257 / KCTC 12902 / NCIMB 13706 / S10) TaxID=768704 RepID=J7IVF8_DESMD|nr:PocR ligand-binding domain-containing protein [Desulfosporosinus meridiei]AFQ44144.1 response regulator containing CheY-like receiver domain and AraC-type DNA-binding domain [Desulfosporosinus meridiei DSM 13257]